MFIKKEAKLIELTCGILEVWPQGLLASFPRGKSTIVTFQGEKKIHEGWYQFGVDCTCVRWKGDIK